MILLLQLQFCCYEFKNSSYITLCLFCAHHQKKEQQNSNKRTQNYSFDASCARGVRIAAICEYLRVLRRKGGQANRLWAF